MRGAEKFVELVEKSVWWVRTCNGDLYSRNRSLLARMQVGIVMSNDFCSNVTENSEKDLCDTGISLVFYSGHSRYAKCDNFFAWHCVSPKN